MSFTIQVKSEICTKDFTFCCAKSLLSSFLIINGKIKNTDSYQILIIYSFNKDVAQFIFNILKKYYPKILCDIKVSKYKKLSHPDMFSLTIIGEDINALLSDQGLIINNEKLFSSVPLEQNEQLKNEHCARAFIAGSFLAAGSINSPSTSNYHLELQLHESSYTLEMAKFINRRFKLNFKVIQRRNKIILYLKKSTSISDFLKLIDCYDAVLLFENERISRDVYNSINRFNNIDISNQQKVLKASDEQIAMIRKIKKVKMFGLLSPKSQTLANLRLKNPEVSLSELSFFFKQETGLEITKSGINHLMREIRQIVDEIEKDS